MVDRKHPFYSIHERTRDWTRFDKWCVIAYLAWAGYAFFIHNLIVN